MKTKKKYVMIVDDDPLTLEMVKFRLKKFKINLLCYTKAEEFLQTLKKVRPSLCIVDLNISTEGVGYLVLKAIRRVYGGDLPVVILSGMDDPESVAQAMELGATDFITKPPQKEEFQDKILSYLSPDEVLEDLEYIKKVPPQKSKALIKFPIKITEIDQNGVKFESPFLIVKNTIFNLPNTLVESMNLPNYTKNIKMSVDSNWVVAESKTFGGHASFISEDQSLRQQLKHFLERSI